MTAAKVSIETWRKVCLRVQTQGPTGIAPFLLPKRGGTRCRSGLRPKVGAYSEPEPERVRPGPSSSCKASSSSACDGFCFVVGAEARALGAVGACAG